ncbi:MAG TPA: hypothetical protein VFQ80_13605 [Thermomicrobiales bacterium]|nr:hypothetical protein [Thermomicrobiales bacterium]
MSDLADPAADAPRPAAPPPSSAAAAPPAESATPVRRPNPFGRWLFDGAALIISAASFVLSSYAVFVAGQPPDVWLSAPAVARVAQGEDAAWLYLQPRFVDAGRNARVEVITAIRLEVAGGDAAVESFHWAEQGSWTYDHASRSLTWAYVGDPAPLVVSPSAPQLPICLFAGPAGSSWKAGPYRVTIVADRAVGGAPLRASFAMTIPPDAIAAVNAPRGGQFRDLPTQPD